LKGGKRPPPFNKVASHAGGHRFKSCTAHFYFSQAHSPMRLPLLLVLTSILLVFLLAGCSGEPDIYREPDEVITVKVNQEFIIATETSPPTGYMWTAIVDESMLELISSTVESNRVEIQGEEKTILEQHFRCRALKKGATEVQLNLRGPDVKHSWDQKVFPVEIR